MNPIFESEIIDISFQNKFLDAIKPDTKSFLFPLYDIFSKHQSKNSKKVINIFNECCDIKGAKRDVLIILKNINNLKKYIEDILTSGQLDHQAFIHEAAFKACIVEFISFFSDSKMSFKFDHKRLFKSENQDYYKEFHNIRNKIFAHREYYTSDLILFNFNNDSSHLYIDGHGYGKNNLFLFSQYKESLLIDYLSQLSVILLKNINEILIQKIFELEICINEDKEIFNMFKNFHDSTPKNNDKNSI